MPPRRLKTIALPEAGGSIVLYDAYRPGKYPARNIENLVREDALGNRVWSATLPQEGPSDSFTDVHLDGDRLIAHTCSCWIVSVDIGTGIVTRIAFTK
jgi:hypothetical protein